MHGSARVKFVVASMLLVMPTVAVGQTDAYPSKAVRIVVGFTPGSATDVTARLFAQKFAEAWGVAVAVDNVPGAAGSVGAARVAKAPPDGYSLLYGANGAITVAPSLIAKLPYDPNTDFAPIGMLLSMPSILAVNNDLPVKTVQDLMALGRAQPGKLSYATPGAGTPQHIAGELLKLTAKVDMTHVPYKGAVLTDVIGGRVPITLQNAGAIVPMVRDGRLRGLAVTSLRRAGSLPDLPTLAESGFPGFEAISWFGLFAPAGTPPAILAKVYQESTKILAQPDMRARFTQLALDISGSTGSELATIVRTDIEKWAKVIRDAGITAGD
jgi:tripartite-type tricarboxylate transporter receptor subunit TctC